jgi:hypothetical protein
VKKYYIEKDGVKEEVDFVELCEKAESLGYIPGGDIFRTSGAASFLRLSGYKVEENI